LTGSYIGEYSKAYTLTHIILQSACQDNLQILMRNSYNNIYTLKGQYGKKGGHPLWWSLLRCRFCWLPH